MRISFGDMLKFATDEFGSEVEEFYIWTNVKASAPKGSATTDESSATPKEIEIPCTASPNNFILDSDKKPVSEIVWRGYKTAVLSVLNLINCSLQVPQRN